MILPAAALMPREMSERPIRPVESTDVVYGLAPLFERGVVM